MRSEGQGQGTRNEGKGTRDEGQWLMEGSKENGARCHPGGRRLVFRNGMNESLAGPRWRQQGTNAKRKRLEEQEPVVWIDDTKGSVRNL